MLVKVGREPWSPLAAPALGEEGMAVGTVLGQSPELLALNQIVGRWGSAGGRGGGRRSIATPCCTHPLCSETVACRDSFLFAGAGGDKTELQQELTNLM